MKHFVLPALAAIFMAGQASADEWKSIKIATEGAYPPYNSTNAAGELEGFEIDLMADLCARMEAECEIVSQAWDGIIPALTEGKYDAIMAGMSITEERRQTISFSRSYSSTPARFVVLKDSNLAEFSAPIDRINMDEVDDAEKAAIDTVVETFGNLTIGVQTATIHENFLKEYFGNSADVRSYDTQENLDLDLQAGRIDVALADTSYWHGLLQSDAGADMAMVGPGFDGGIFGEGVGVGIRKEDEALVSKFNEAINAAIDDGTVSELAIKWFGFDAAAK